LYHFDRRKRAPGEKAASTKPRKNRVRRACVKLRVMPAREQNSWEQKICPLLTCQTIYDTPKHHAGGEIYGGLSNIV
jgi:hypothetical protein